MSLSTPVAFIIFNRPHTTRRVFAEIARARPRKLLVIADGPRSVQEVEACRQTREVIEQVDWDCEVLTDFSDVNLGCKKRVSSGLDWVFAQCEEAIILEDDCLPHMSFFPYCEELLARYREDDRVMIINGNNFQVAGSEPDSYYFSRFTHIWGWASWRRAWRHYDVTLADWPARRETSWLVSTLDSEEGAAKWRQEFDAVFSGEFDTWDFQWSYAVWAGSGLSIAPTENLITNIGFGPDATHTKDAVSREANLPASGLTFPLRHPAAVSRDADADARGLKRILEISAPPAPLHLPQRLRRKTEFLQERLDGRMEKPLRALTSPRLTFALAEAGLRLRRREPSPGELALAKRILVIRLDEIGDVALTSPFLRELRRNAPQAWITLVVKPATRNLVELCPYVDEVLEFDGQLFGRFWPLRRHQHALRFARLHLWQRRFDLALLPRWDQDQSHATFLAYFSGAAQRVGYSEKVVERKRKENRGYDCLMTHTLNQATPRHEQERNLELVHFLGGVIGDRRMETWLSEEDRARAKQILNTHGYDPKNPLIALGVGAGEAKRIWPVERFSALGAWLQETFDAHLLIVGGPEDGAAGKQLQIHLGAKVINSAGQTTLRQTNALLERCGLFIGNDSGPLHLAAATGIPTIEISCHPKNGPANHANAPERFAPTAAHSVVLRPEHSLFPCIGACQEQVPHCITAITVLHVQSATETLLALRSLTAERHP